MLVLSVNDQVLYIEGGRIFATSWATDSEFGVQRRGSFGDFYFLGALQAKFMFAYQLDEGTRLFLTI